MPFTQVGPDDYVSPSGKHFSKKQVEMYYATDGFKKVDNDNEADTKTEKSPLHKELLEQEIKKRQPKVR